MNHELLQLIRETGYLTDAALSPQARYDLLTPRFWRTTGALGYNVPTLRRKLWVASGRPEEELIRILPEALVEKAVRASEKEKDPRKRIKETAAAIALLYKTGEKAIRAAIDANLENPSRMRAETGRIRRILLTQAASWLGVAVPGMYLAGSRAGTLQGPHAKAADAMAIQEMNRFREVDATIGRHVEEVIAEAEKRRAQAAALRGKVPTLEHPSQRSVREGGPEGGHSPRVLTQAERDYRDSQRQWDNDRRRMGIPVPGDELATLEIPGEPKPKPERPLRASPGDLRDIGEDDDRPEGGIYTERDPEVPDDPEWREEKYQMGQSRIDALRQRGDISERQAAILRRDLDQSYSDLPKKKPELKAAVPSNEEMAASGVTERNYREYLKKPPEKLSLAEYVAAKQFQYYNERGDTLPAETAAEWYHSTATKSPKAEKKPEDIIDNNGAFSASDIRWSKPASYDGIKRIHPVIRNMGVSDSNLGLGMGVRIEQASNKKDWNIVVAYTGFDRSGAYTSRSFVIGQSGPLRRVKSEIMNMLTNKENLNRLTSELAQRQKDLKKNYNYRKGIDYGDISVPRLVGDHVKDDIEDEELEKGSDIERVRTILADEEDGPGFLDRIINESNDPRVKEVFEAIKTDEQKHVAALQQLAEMLETGEDEGEGEEPEPEVEPGPEEESGEEYDYAEGEPADIDLDDVPKGDLSEDLEDAEDDLDKEDADGDLIDDIREVLAEHEAEKAEDEDEDDEDLPEFLKSDEDEEDEEEDEVSKVMKAYKVPIIVSKGEQQIVYGVVSEPDTVDLQGDRLSKSAIRAACHKFMQTSQRIGKEHSGPAKASIIESYIAPADFKCNGQVVKSGSWVMAVKVHDPSLWQAIKKGEITGFSIAGTGTRTPF